MVTSWTQKIWIEGDEIEEACPLITRYSIILMRKSVYESSNSERSAIIYFETVNLFENPRHSTDTTVI